MTHNTLETVATTTSSSNWNCCNHATQDSCSEAYWPGFCQRQQMQMLTHSIFPYAQTNQIGQHFLFVQSSHEIFCCTQKVCHVYDPVIPQALWKYVRICIRREVLWWSTTWKKFHEGKIVVHPKMPWSGSGGLWRGAFAVEEKFVIVPPFIWNNCFSSQVNQEAGAMVT